MILATSSILVFPYKIAHLIIHSIFAGVGLFENVNRDEGIYNMGLTDAAKRYGLNKVYDYLEKDPRTNLPKVMDFVDKVTPGT